MKKYIFLVITLFIISAIFGYYYGEKIFSEDSIDSNLKLQQNSENKINIDNTNTLETINQEIKILPSTKLGIRKKFKTWSHTSFEFVELPEELINKTEDEIKQLYPDWNIDEFHENKVILSKEFDGICDEHFFMTLGNEYIEIYRLLDEKNTKVLYQSTDINTKYLTKEDIEKLKKGIYIYGKDILNSAIEDFE